MTLTIDEKINHISQLIFGTQDLTGEEKEQLDYVLSLTETYVNKLQLNFKDAANKAYVNVSVLTELAGAYHEVYPWYTLDQSLTLAHERLAPENDNYGPMSYLIDIAKKAAEMENVDKSELVWEQSVAVIKAIHIYLRIGTN